MHQRDAWEAEEGRAGGVARARGNERAWTGAGRAESFAGGVARTAAIVAAFVALGLGGALAAEWAAEDRPRGAEPGAPSYVPVVEPDAPTTGPSDLRVVARGDAPVPDPAAAPVAWLVDGYNALHVGLLRGAARAGAWWSAEGREALLARVRRFEGGAGRVAVVFDGPDARELPDPGAAGAEAGRARVVFAPSADAWLLRRAGAAAPGEVVVVTADRRLAARARARGATVVSPQDFLARCPEERPGGSV